MTLARRIRECRYTRGWGPDELAHRASISRTALYQIESGRTEMPRAGTLRRIASALGVPTEALMGEARPAAALAGNAGPSHEREAAGCDPSDRPRLATDAVLDDPGDLTRKFRVVLASPSGESLARIVEESYRLLPR